MAKTPEIPTALFKAQQTRLYEWYARKNQLEDLAKQELEARRELVDALFPEHFEGSRSYRLPAGATITAMKRVNRKLATVEGLPEDAPVKHVTLLDAPALKAMDDEERLKFEMDFVTVTPSTPGLSVKSRK